MPFYLVQSNIQNRADVIQNMCPGFPSIEKLDAHHMAQGWRKEDDPQVRYHGQGIDIKVARIKRIGDFNPRTQEADEK